MPYNRPSLAQLVDRVGASWRARFPGADTSLRQSPDRAIIAAIAGSTDEDLAYLDWQVRQLFPFQADTEFLERWAAFKAVYRKPATAAAGTVTLSGTVGRTAPAGSQMQTADGALIVALTADATIGGGGTVAAAAQSVGGGSRANLGVGTTLTFVGTPAGFADSGPVTATFAGGADAETDAQLRLRTARAYAQPSFGGNQNDWQRAALAVPGVTRVFTSPAVPTPGAVTIWPLLDGLRVNGIPVGTPAWYRPGTGPSAGIAGTGDQRLVLDAVLATRPVCAHVYVSALATQALDVTIASLANDTPAVRAAIAAELANMLLAKVAQPVTPGLDAIATGYTIYRQWIDEAIARAAGLRKSDLSLPAADVVVPAGTLAVPGVNTYV